MLAKNLYQPEKLEKKSCRDGYGDALLILGKKNKNVVVVSADLAESTRVHHFAKKFPQRFIEVGVAEQNMLGVAAGLALSGKIPFASSFGVFSPGRNWDQLRISVCYSQANVKIIASHTGLSVGADGASHQALEDLAITRCLPNLIILAPDDYLETKKATIAASQIKGPVYLRFARHDSPVFTVPKTPFKIGRANILIKGNDITIIACGPLVYEAILAAKELAKQKIKAEVINNHTIKPLDTEAALNSAKKCKCVITVEEHSVSGGLGEACASLLYQEKIFKPFKIVAFPDEETVHGSQGEIFNHYGISEEGLYETALKLM